MFQFFKRKKVTKVKEKCSCCGYYTLDEKDVYEICPVCFWEDNSETEDPDEYNECNRISLSEARKNYLSFGACKKEFRINVRRPKKSEKKCTNKPSNSNS